MASAASLSKNQHSVRFVQRYANFHAYRTLQRFQGEFLEKEIIMEINDTILGTVVNYSYRLNRKNPFTIWFKFSCVCIDDVHYLIQYMDRVRQTWIKHNNAQENKNPQEAQEIQKSPVDTSDG